jgi:hypothetical protein
MKHMFLGVLMVLFAIGAQGQQAAQKNTHVSSSVQKPDSKLAPTLGFNHAKDISPIIDDDAIHEEWKLEKELPGNKFVYEKRAMHEASLMNEFMEGFKSSKECDGITFYLKTDKKPAFTVQISVMGHDDPHQKEQTWTWILGYPGDPSPADGKSHGLGGMGIQSNAKLTAKDVCLTIWDDVDPNHFKKPGGRIE